MKGKGWVTNEEKEITCKHKAHDSSNKDTET